MIDRVEINNWKNHDHLELEFKKGINFIIGLNGVGKTSVIQAINFALGTRKSHFKDITSFIKTGKFHSKIVVDISKSGNKYRVDVEIDKDNIIRLLYDLKTEEIIASGDEDVNYKLRSVYGISEIIRDRLLFVDEGEIYIMASAFTQITKMKEKFGDDLKRTIGLDLLQRLHGLFKSQSHSFDEEIKDLKQNLQDCLDEKKVEELEKRKSELRKEYQNLDEQLNKIRKDTAGKQKQLGQIEIEIKTLSDWRVEFQKTNELIIEIFEKNKFDKNILNLIKNEEDKLLIENKELEKQKNSVQKLLNQSSGQLEIYRHFTDALLKISTIKAEEYKCPLCDSNLSKQKYESLASDLQQKTKRIRDEISEFQEKLNQFDINCRTCNKKYSKVKDILSKLEMFSDKFKSIDEITIRSTAFSNKYKAITEDLKLLTEEQENIIKRLDKNVREYERRNSELKNPTVQKVFKTLINKSKKSLICEMVSYAFEKTLINQKNIYLQSVITTLNQELTRFRIEDNYTLHIDDNGIPNVEVDGKKRDFSQLSSGERTAAYILTRMLLNHFITKGDFIVLDEPFEHLDLDNKKYLRDFISDAFTKNYMDQIIITTIQESLTRAFLQDKNTHLIYLQPNKTI